MRTSSGSSAEHPELTPGSPPRLFPSTGLQQREAGLAECHNVHVLALPYLDSASSRDSTLKITPGLPKCLGVALRNTNYPCSLVLF